MTRRKQWVLGVLLGVLSLALFWLLGEVVLYRATVSVEQRSDFVMLQAAGVAALDGADVYGVKHPRGWPYYYPPGMTVLMMPLALLPLAPAVIVWYVLNVLAWMWMCARIIQFCDRMTGRATGTIVVLAALANVGPSVTALQRGQTALLLGALMVESLWWLARRSDFRCGLLIGVAAGLKIYPALLIAPLVVWRRWRGLAGFGVALLALWVALPMALMGPRAGWNTLRDWLTQILLPFLADPHFAGKAVFSEFNQFALSNQSFFAVLARWLARDALPADEPFGGTLANLSIDQVRLAAAGCSGVLLLLVAWICWRTRPPEKLAGAPRYRFEDAALWSLMMVAAICISHVGWNHYYAVLTLNYALAGVAIDQLPRTGTTRRVIGAALLVSITANWLHLAVPLARQGGVLMMTGLGLALLLNFIRVPVGEPGAAR